MVERSRCASPPAIAIAFSRDPASTRGVFCPLHLSPGRGAGEGSHGARVQSPSAARSLSFCAILPCRGDLLSCLPPSHERHAHMDQLEPTAEEGIMEIIMSNCPAT